MKNLFKVLSVVLILVAATFMLASCKPEEEPARVGFKESLFTNYSKLEIVNKEVLASNKSGGKVSIDKQFVELEDNVYYVVEDRVVTGTYLCGNRVYLFDENGVYQDQPINNLFFEFKGAVYYVVNNSIVTGQMVLDGYVYDFGKTGEMITGWHKGETEERYFDSCGRFIVDKEFVSVNGDTYYLVNNRVVYGHQVIDNAIYNFGKDGKMVIGEKDGYTYDKDGKMVLENSGLVMIKNDKSTIYYLEKNAIQKGERTVVNELIYLDANGLLFVGKLYDNVYLSQNDVILLVNGTAWVSLDGVLYGIDEDNDKDNLPNGLELEMGTDLTNADTDGDGHNDDIDLAPFDPKHH